MAQAVVLVIGVSGAGKSWLCRQLTKEFHYLPHDGCWAHPDAKPSKGVDAKWGPPGSVSTHLEELIQAARTARRPVISEVPFGERKLREALEDAKIRVIPVFVVEPDGIVAARYERREGKPPQPGVLTRARTLKSRADEWKAFSGTSEEVLEHLKHLKTRISAGKGSLGSDLAKKVKQNQEGR